MCIRDRYEFKDEKDSDFKCLTKSLAKWYKVADGAGNSDKSLDEVLDALISGDIKPQEQPEEGTSISLAQLEDICKNVEFIKSQIGEGDIVPDWALQHITVAADNIHEVVVFFEGERCLYSSGLAFLAMIILVASERPRY